MRIVCRGVISIIVGALLSSCAEFTTSTKNVDLRSQSLALDVKQRVVISQSRSEVGQSLSVICAEPSPDALTVIGASAGISLNRGSGTSGSFATALSESGAFVGLRTQSIQLLRDAMYRLCEGYASGAVTQPDFAAMQRRYQSTMMGLIAIEQLTGPVVASQALLIASADAKAGATAGDAAVSTAQAKVQTATDAVLVAQTELDKASAKLESSNKGVADAQQKLAVARNVKPPVQADIDSLVTSLATLQAEQQTSQLDLADKRRKLDAAYEVKRLAGIELNQAKSSVAASGSGAGRLGDVAKATTDSNVALAAAVTEIVREINLSYTKDGCLAWMLEIMQNPESLEKLAGFAEKAQSPRDNETQVNPVLVLRATINTCQKILEAESKRVAEKETKAGASPPRNLPITEPGRG
ncbi:hypothetical protein [Pseudoduganella namucuonensis]|uniref:Uncharacterized protein n=1 Tax=Pseudoduganella namucuonensis TaxID=1035707 RepID=A0A1I7H0N8_9BURK|nr:hypothetical protein [Pseudoduganella namucuonensis]SFU54278.1 hypothetical protein SAMN05216552_1004244 [Pseudoduganella namucuonensis]